MHITTFFVCLIQSTKQWGHVLRRGERENRALRLGISRVTTFYSQFSSAWISRKKGFSIPPCVMSCSAVSPYRAPHATYMLLCCTCQEALTKLTRYWLHSAVHIHIHVCLSCRVFVGKGFHQWIECYDMKDGSKVRNRYRPHTRCFFGSMLACRGPCRIGRIETG